MDRIATFLDVRMIADLCPEQCQYLWSQLVSEITTTTTKFCTQFRKVALEKLSQFRTGKNRMDSFYWWLNVGSKGHFCYKAITSADTPGSFYGCIVCGHIWVGKIIWLPLELLSCLWNFPRMKPRMTQ